MSTASRPVVSAGSPVYGPYVKLPGALWAVFVVGALLGLATTNPLLTAVSILLLPCFMSLLWRPGETPVLLFAISFQWLQVTAKVFHANVLGVDVTTLSQYAFVDLPSIERAVWLGLVGLVVLAVGMRVGMWKLRGDDTRKTFDAALDFSPKRAFVLYLVCSAVAAALAANAWSFGGFVQVIRAAAGINWIGFFILGYVVLKRKEQYVLFVAAVAIEFIGGIGFFSGFKFVLFVTLIIIFTIHHKLKPSVVVAGAVLLVALLVLGAGWTSIKEEYRSYLNQGTRSQATLVSRSDQLSKLAELVGEIQGVDLSESIGKLFERVAYVDYFALAMDYVPEYTPHEGGELWKNAILHVLTPRALFPDKPPLTGDSEITMRYTGLQLAGQDEGTSISIGYMGESYVDFGPIGMFVPVFVLGVLWGLMYTYFLTHARTTVFGYAFATTLLLSAYQFEMTGIKLLGGVLMKFLVFALILGLVEKPVMRWLSTARSKGEVIGRALAYQGD